MHATTFDMERTALPVVHLGRYAADRPGKARQVARCKDFLLVPKPNQFTRSLDIDVDVDTVTIESSIDVRQLAICEYFFIFRLQLVVAVVCRKSSRPKLKVSIIFVQFSPNMVAILLTRFCTCLSYSSNSNLCTHKNMCI